MLNPPETKQTTKTPNIRRQNDDRGHSIGMREVAQSQLKRDNHSLDNDCVEPVADLKLNRKKKKKNKNKKKR